MGDGYDVSSDALRKYAKAVDAAAKRIEGIRRRTGTLELSQGVFGKLPESDNLKADYDKQTEESQRDLKDAGDALERVADDIREAASSYDETEDTLTQGFGGGR
ncbi:hypothetical protein GCM10010406_51680 [Streptomyces thermolineatus]|uniref:Uncharacterized protein n=2 Tax=Streptomyces TaxID=1883 RepID=A0ABN3MXT6_9ACTN